MGESGDMTVIASEAILKGELTFEGIARVNGTVEGKITATGSLHVAENGTCKAQITAADVQVDGSIEGDVTASQRVELSAGAKVRGDIMAEKLVTAEGASITGHVNVGPGASKASAKPKTGSARSGESAAPLKVTERARQAQPAVAAAANA